MNFKDLINEDMALTYQRQIDMVQAERDRLSKQKADLDKKLEVNGKKLDGLRAQLDRYNKQRSGKPSTTTEPTE